MKKSIFIAAALAAFSFASCKKDYTCVCKDDQGYEWATYTVHTTREKAKDDCNGYDETWANYDAVCTIE